jgi:hypothetical protein
LLNACDAAAYSEEFNSHLETILASPSFRSSRRSQEFLRLQLRIMWGTDGIFSSVQSSQNFDYFSGLTISSRAERSCTIELIPVTIGVRW